MRAFFLLLSVAMSLNVGASSRRNSRRLRGPAGMARVGTPITADNADWLLFEARSRLVGPRELAVPPPGHPMQRLRAYLRSLTLNPFAQNVHLADVTRPHGTDDLKQARRRMDILAGIENRLRELGEQISENKIESVGSVIKVAPAFASTSNTSRCGPSRSRRRSKPPAGRTRSVSWREQLSAFKENSAARFTDLKDQARAKAQDFKETTATTPRAPQ